MTILKSMVPVSYTHLDVYKRQSLDYALREASGSLYLFIKSWCSLVLLKHCAQQMGDMDVAARAETMLSKCRESEKDVYKRQIKASDQDLGSREALENEEDLIWYPAEVNTSIRPGWFYHEEEDCKVRTLEELIHIYYNSVGGNATFLLNIPPTREGIFHENDVKRLEEMGDYLKAVSYTHLLGH